MRNNLDDRPEPMSVICAKALITFFASGCAFYLTIIAADFLRGLRITG